MTARDRILEVIGTHTYLGHPARDAVRLADAVADAILPPSSLPAVLSSVEDVARVAAAAGLEHTLSRRRPEVIRWVCRSTSALPELRAETRDVDGALRVVLLVERTDDHHGLAWSAEWYWNGQGGGGIPLGPVWSAIQAARGKTGGES